MKLLKLFKKTNTPYTSEQPLMMAYERFESAWDNFGKFLYQFQPETKTLIRKLERILHKLYRQNLSLLFNETYLNEQLLPNYTHTHTHTHTHTYISSSSPSSSSCCATSMDIPDPLSPLLPIIHLFWQVFRATSCILT